MTRPSARQPSINENNGGPALNATGQPPHDAVGAYLLDALPDDERRAFERHLATCEACQQEARQLAPIVGLLPRLLELEDDAAAAPVVWGDADEGDEPRAAAVRAPLPAPSAGLRNRILTAARADEDDASDGSPGGSGSGGATDALTAHEEPDAPRRDRAGTDSGADEDEETEAPVMAPPPVRMRPRGRIRPGLAPPREEAPPVVMAPSAARPRREPRSEDDDDIVPVWLSRWEAVTRLGYDRLAAGFLALVAVGTLLWALALQSRLDDRGEEIRALREQMEQQQSQLAQVQQRPDVTMLNVSATQEGPETARGTLFYAPGIGQGTLTVSGLPAPPEGKVYQLWYIGGGRPVPEPGGTFTVDAQGNGILPITEEVPPFQQVGLTIEPQGGSQTPTLPVVATGAHG